MQIFLVAALLIAIVAVIFALQNTMPVVISFLAWQTEGSLALVLLITLLFGVLISLLVSVPTVIRRSRTIASQKKRIQKLESTLEEREKKIQELEAGAAVQPPQIASPSASPAGAIEPPSSLPPDPSV
jgi:putative membrane protein